MERRGKEHIVKTMEGEALKVLTRVCICHFPLAKAWNWGVVSMEGQSKNWRLDVVEVFYEGGLHAGRAFQDLVPVWRGRTLSSGGWGRQGTTNSSLHREKPLSQDSQNSPCHDAREAKLHYSVDTESKQRAFSWESLESRDINPLPWAMLTT